MKRSYLLFAWLLSCLFLSAGFWLGLFANPNKFESLEIRDASVEAVKEAWLIRLYIRNTGTIESEISHVEVNGTIINGDPELSNADDLIIPLQREAEVWVKIGNPPYKRGTTAIITIITTKGNHYMEVVILPEFGSWSY